MMGEYGRASRAPIISVAIVVVAEIAMIAAAAIHAAAGVVVVVVIVTIRVAPSRSWVDGLHRDLRSGLGCGVEGLSPGVILCPELYSGLHGDLGLLGKAVATVGWRGATVAGGRSMI